MNNELYLRNKLSIYQKICEKQENLVILYREALLLRKQYILNHDDHRRTHRQIQDNKEEINKVKNEIQRLKDRLILFTL